MAQQVPAADGRTVANMELVGGRPVVDFVNTLSDRSTGTPYDRLRTYGDLLDWCVRVALFGTAEAGRLTAVAEACPAAADAALGRAHEVREALYQLFRAETADQEPPPAALNLVNAVLAEGLSNRRLQPGRDGFGWAWNAGPDRLDWMLWPLVWSAAELLTSAEVARLKECGQPDCRWVFLDLSKNRSRRWCTMDDCGNRAKARRHYQRHRA